MFQHTQTISKEACKYENLEDTAFQHSFHKENKLTSTNCNSCNVPFKIVNYFFKSTTFQLAFAYFRRMLFNIWHDFPQTKFNSRITTHKLKQFHSRRREIFILQSSFHDLQHLEESLSLWICPSMKREWQSLSVSRFKVSRKGLAVIKNW